MIKLKKILSFLALYFMFLGPVLLKYEDDQSYGVIAVAIQGYEVLSYPKVGRILTVEAEKEIPVDYMSCRGP